MTFCIIIPFFNEGKYIKKTLNSFQSQTIVPTRLVLVDDGSTDNSYELAKTYSDENPWISVIESKNISIHQPGSKVINAFYIGLNSLKEDYDLIGKFDADIVLPSNYFEFLISEFQNNKLLGIASGNLYIKKANYWVYENISKKSKTRGPIKLYRKKCFQEIGGLKPSMGWDTVDELLARYHGWKIKTIPELKVKHLRPTGKTYHKSSKFKQGKAFYKLRYGYLITAIAAFKLSFLKKKPALFFQYLKGYKLAKKKKLPYLVTAEEGKWIRKYRWKKIKEKLF